MPGAYIEALVALLAICDGVAGSERARWILIPPVIFLAWGLFAWFCIWRGTDPDERASLSGLLGLCVATGGLIFLVPEGISGNGDYLTRFWISLLVTGGIGVAWPFVSRKLAFWRSIGVAIAGDVLVPGGLILLLFWALGLSGSCLD
jgi:hypothetical protein